MNRQSNRFAIKPLMLLNTMRKLWEQHDVWTRSFIISTAEDLEDLEAVTKRLLQNPSDFAQVLRIFYGDQKANQFKVLLEQHLLIAADLVNSAKAGNSRAAEEARKKWYENADEIAIFLSSINPYWNQKEWQMMLYEHLRLVEDEAVKRLSKQYEEDIKTYDLIEEQSLKMADYMANGIIKQFGIY